MNEIKVLDLLPNSLRIYSADNQLYRIGLCLKPPKIYVKRHCFSKPIFVAFILWYYLITNVILLVNNGKNELIVLIFGDFSHILGIGIQYKIAFIFTLIFTISIQLIYYYNYWKGIEPTFLSVFEMMSGLVTPNSIGLSDPQSVRRFINTSKTLFKINDFICNKTVPFMGLYVLITFISYKPILTALLYGIPNSVMNSFVIFHMFNIVFNQMIYFYLLCCYLKLN